MAKIVEICGSPGVGKSTIFKEIERRRKSTDIWTTANNINPYGEQNFKEYVAKILEEIKKGPYRKSLNNQNKESTFAYIKRIYKEIKRGRNYSDPTSKKEAGERFVEQFPEYMNACWGNIYYRQVKSINGLDLRLEKADFIYKIIKKIQIITENKTNKITIIDEGLINLIDRALYKSVNITEEQEEIASLLKVMPLPDALVYIETDLHENAKRLLLRKDVRSMHKGLSMNDLIDYTKISRERVLTAIELLKSIGIPLLYLNSNDHINENACKIIDFAKNLKAEKSHLNTWEPKLNLTNS